MLRETKVKFYALISALRAIQYSILKSMVALAMTTLFSHFAVAQTVTICVDPSFSVSQCITYTGSVFADDDPSDITCAPAFTNSQGEAEEIYDPYSDPSVGDWWIPVNITFIQTCDDCGGGVVNTQYYIPDPVACSSNSPSPSPTATPTPTPTPAPSPTPIDILSLLQVFLAGDVSVAQDGILMPQQILFSSEPTFPFLRLRAAILVPTGFTIGKQNYWPSRVVPIPTSCGLMKTEGYQKRRYCSHLLKRHKFGSARKTNVVG
jgi:hypothetical protein